MADDFDESAALPVGEVIAELRANLGLPADGSTPEAGKEKEAAADAGDDKTEKADSEDKTANDDIKDDDTADDDDAGEKDKASTREASAAKKVFGKYVDEEAAAQGWIHLQNSLASMSAKLEKLEEKLEKTGESSDTHPDIVKLNEELSDLTEDIKENKASQRGLQTKGEAIRADIAKLQGRIDATEDDATKDRLEGKIELLKDRLDVHGQKWLELERDNKRAMRKLTSIDSRRKEVEEAIKAERQESRKANESTQAWRQEQNFRYSTAINALPKLYEMTPGQHERVGKLIKADLKEYVDRNPDGDPIDLVKFVAARAKVHTAEFGIKTRFVKAGSEKKDISGTGKRPGSADTTPTKGSSKAERPSAAKAEEDAAAVRRAIRKEMGAL